jgi:hypothetical protein
VHLVRESIDASRLHFPEHTSCSFASPDAPFQTASASSHYSHVGGCLHPILEARMACLFHCSEAPKSIPHGQYFHFKLRFSTPENYHNRPLFVFPCFDSFSYMMGIQDSQFHLHSFPQPPNNYLTLRCHGMTCCMRQCGHCPVKTKRSPLHAKMLYTYHCRDCGSLERAGLIDDVQVVIAQR